MALAPGLGITGGQQHTLLTTVIYWWNTDCADSWFKLFPDVALCSTHYSALTNFIVFAVFIQLSTEHYECTLYSNDRQNLLQQLQSYIIILFFTW